MASAAREANLLIDRRTFSWTELFNQFEATLPADVRISTITPHIAWAARASRQRLLDVAVANVRVLGAGTR